MLHAETHTTGHAPSGLLHACILMHVHEHDCRWDYAIKERDAEITELKRRLVDSEHRAREAASKAAEELRVMGADLQVRRQLTCLRPLFTQTKATLSTGFSRSTVCLSHWEAGVRSCRLDMSESRKWHLMAAVLHLVLCSVPASPAELQTQLGAGSSRVRFTQQGPDNSEACTASRHWRRRGGGLCSPSQQVFRCRAAGSEGWRCPAELRPKRVY